MPSDNDILMRLGHKDGMTVPDGYFADFAQRLGQSLPVTEYEESAKQPHVVAPRTLWQRVRPYVYMAAMFAGVWCMLKMFTMLTGQHAQDETSPVLAEALNNDTFVKDYIIDNVNQYDLYDELYDEEFDIDNLYLSDEESGYDISVNDN